MSSNEDDDAVRPLPSKVATVSESPRPVRFDHLLTELLDRNDGVFLGEQHDSPALLQSITKLLPMLKAHGVGSVSLELSQDRVDAMKHATSYGEYLTSNMKAGRRYLPDEAHFELVQQASKLRLEILGHEHPRYGTDADRLEDGSQELTELIRVAVSPEGMRERDEHAAKYTRSHRSGKVLVIGGRRHSGCHTKADAMAVSEEERLINGGGVPADYTGLDSKLGFPSVDFRWDIAGTQTGSTVKTDVSVR